MNHKKKKSQRSNGKDHSSFSHIKLKTKIIHGPITQFKSNYIPTTTSLLVTTSTPPPLVEASSFPKRPGFHPELQVIPPPPYLHLPSITPTASPLLITTSLPTFPEEAFHSIRCQARVLISRSQTSILSFRDQSNFLKTRQNPPTPPKASPASETQRTPG